MSEPNPDYGITFATDIIGENGYYGTTGCIAPNTTGNYWTFGYLPQQYPPLSVQSDPQPFLEQYREKNIPLPEGVVMKSLYKVTLCYGEDRKAPVVMEFDPVIADSDEDAKIKSGVYAAIDKEWDADFVTVLIQKIGDVKVKERVKEVRQV
jgi:hypothetical protein